tara:strand:- start:268 stop:735 length:468 start_codon:yes stop_codon:yes gene_type:complete
MKTFNEFEVESRQYLKEIAPVVAAAGGLALKGIGAGIAAYSAYDAAKQARKGNYGRAAFSALGAIPGAGIFKGAKFLSKSDKIAKGVRGLSSVNKFAGPEGRNIAFNALGKNKVVKNKNNKTNNNIANNSSSTPTKTLSLSDTTFKKTGSKTYGV